MGPYALLTMSAQASNNAASGDSMPMNSLTGFGGRISPIAFSFPSGAPTDMR